LEVFFGGKKGGERRGLLEHLKKKKGGIIEKAGEKRGTLKMERVGKILGD